MSYIHLRNVKIRPFAEGQSVDYIKRYRTDSKSTKFLNGHDFILPSNVPDSSLWDESLDVKRDTSCDVEMDCRIEDILNNASGQFATFGSQTGLNVLDFGETGITFQLGDTLYISHTEAGHITNVAPPNENCLIQNIGKIERATPTTNMTIKVGGAGRSNATPNLNDGNIFLGNASNQSVTASLDTSVSALGYITNSALHHTYIA